MSLSKVSPGDNLPTEFNVIIEISMNSDPVKYEVDEETGAIVVDRFMLTAMRYPTNYGYIPQTIADDGDPVDVLVVTPFPVQTGSVIRCRAIGMLQMEDEAGGDAKVLAVPVNKLYPDYAHLQEPQDLPEHYLASIQHFFERYKDLEKGKWVKVKGWEPQEVALAEITQGVERFKK